MKLLSLKRAFRLWLRDIFKSRNIIVISDEAVKHLTLSTKFQAVGIAVVTTLVVWVSYSTGNYMAAQSVIREKDKAIIDTSLEARKIEHDFTLLKRDLLKLSENPDRELSEYSKFVLDQYENQPQAAKDSGFTLTFDEGDASGSKLMDRIAFLESQVQSLENANKKIINDVRTRTTDVVEKYEQIINLTGLSKDSFKKLAAAKAAKASKQGATEEGGLGGPFIPSGPTSLKEDHQAMVVELDYMKAMGDIIESLPLSRPIKNATQMSGFGKRIDPFTRRWARHEGVDMSAPRGAKIYATSDGRIAFSGRKNAYGNMVEISHAHGLTTRYGHLSKVLVRSGQQVKKGDVVGIQGSTGRSTGDHLHYEVRLYNRPLNPSNFLKAGTHVQNHF